MANDIKIQNSNMQELLKLVHMNPELEIVPMVAYEVCSSDDFSYWMGSWGEAQVDEYWSDDERIYFRSKDEDRLVDEEMDNGDSNMSKEDAKKLVDGYAWTKCISVRIELP